MKRIVTCLSLLTCCLLACEPTDPAAEMAIWKAEVLQAEEDFNARAQEKGLVAAFHEFAAADGAIRRGKKVITGKAAIRDWYAQDVRPNETLSWKPTFVDVSAAGDLAYTYGDYVFTSVDTSGNKKESRGIFHTVWKRQKDGTWKYVWD